MDTDVGYRLEVTPPHSPPGGGGGGLACTVEASTIFGAMYGLESLVQLLNHTRALPHSNISIADAPAFGHRGVMLDAGRRFMPLPLLYNVVDVMAASKMNVLHLHASDMCRWAVESQLYPELTASNLSTGTRKAVVLGHDHHLNGRVLKRGGDEGWNLRANLTAFALLRIVHNLLGFPVLALLLLDRNPRDLGTLLLLLPFQLSVDLLGLLVLPCDLAPPSCHQHLGP